MELCTITNLLLFTFLLFELILLFHYSVQLGFFLLGFCYCFSLLLNKLLYLCVDHILLFFVLSPGLFFFLTLVSDLILQKCHILLLPRNQLFSLFLQFSLILYLSFEHLGLYLRLLRLILNGSDLFLGQLSCSLFWYVWSLDFLFDVLNLWVSYKNTLDLILLKHIFISKFLKLTSELLVWDIERWFHFQQLEMLLFFKIYINFVYQVNSFIYYKK